MVIALNTSLRRQRRRLVLIAAVAVLATGVAAAHGALGDHHMGDGMTMCLAVADSALLTVGVALAVRLHTGSWIRPWSPFVAAPVWRPLARPQPRARAGPAVLQVVRR